MPDTDKLIAAIDAYESQSYGSDSDGGDLARRRSLILDAYAGRNIEPAPEGRSQVTDWTIFETVQWILPSFGRIFAGGDDVVEFEPTGPEDEDSAAQESEVLNYLVTQRNNWFLTVLTFCQDALLSPNAYCLVDMEEKLNPELEKYEGISAEQVTLLLDDDVQVVGQAERLDEDNPQPVIDPMSGQPLLDDMTGQPMMQPAVIYDLEIRRTKAKKRLKFTVLPPERCKVGQDTSDFTLEDCNYFEFEDDDTISNLRKLGYDIPDDIADDWDSDTQEDDARNRYNRREELDLPDPSMREVTVRYIWIRYDYDEDGIAELQKVVRVGKTILEREETNNIPVASIASFINTHRHPGTSVGDVVFDLQRIGTALTRQGLDSLYLSTNPRHAASKKVNLDDLMVSRPGGVVQVDTDMPEVAGHVIPLTTEFVFPQALEGLRWKDTLVESRAGVNRMFQGIDDSQLNDYDRVGQLSTMAAQRVEMIARIFANGFERLFRLAHELLIKSGGQSETIKLRGNYVTVNPSEWRSGRDMRIVAPFAAGNKDSLVQRLMIHMQVHREALAAGAPFVQIDDTYELAKMLATATDVPADRIYTDPRTVPPQEPPPDHAMLAIQVENKKADNEAIDEERKVELEQYKTSLNAELEKFKIETNAQVQIMLAQIKQGGQVDMESVKAYLKDRPAMQFNEGLDEAKESISTLKNLLSEVRQAIGEMQNAATAPREIVRKGGKIVGAKVNGTFIPVQDSNA